MRNQITKNWQKVKLGEYVAVKGGKRLPMGFSVQDQETDHPYLRIVDMNKSGLDISDVKYISDEVFKRISQYTISDKDLYISIAGTIGFVGKIPQFLSGANLTENCAKICNFSKDLDRDFLLYFLKSYKGKAEIKAGIGGSSQPKLALYRIENFQLLLPPVEIQQKIASVLSAFDDKIEVNNKIAKTLEEMARALFKEWFIKFRFPGWQKVKFIDSELGKIPKGWRIGKIDNLISIISGYPFSSKLYRSSKDALGVVTIKNVQDGNFVRDFDSFIKKEDLLNKFNTDCNLRDGDILLSLTGNVGRVCFVYGGEYLLNQRVAKLKPKKSQDFAFSYFLFRQTTMQNYLINMAKGSAQPNLSPVETGKIQLCVPPRQILDNFSKLTSPIYQRLIKNTNENQKLAALRDLLLPKLMKGEIKV